MLWWEDGYVLRTALVFGVVVQRQKGRMKRTWKGQVEEELMRDGLTRNMHFATFIGLVHVSISVDTT